MRTAIIALFLLAALSACSPPVKIQKNLDGSTNTTIKTDDGEIKINDKDGTSQIKDDSGFELNTKTGSDGSLDYKGKTSSGDDFSMQSGKGLDLTEFGLQPYPGAVAKDANSSFRADTSQGISASLNVVSKDPAAKVFAFYEPMIVDKKNTSSVNNLQMIGGKTANNSEVYITIQEEDGETKIGYTCSIKKKK